MWAATYWTACRRVVRHPVTCTSHRVKQEGRSKGPFAARKTNDWRGPLRPETAFPEAHQALLVPSLLILSPIRPDRDASPPAFRKKICDLSPRPSSYGQSFVSGSRCSHPDFTP
jgi:hypothetical protein